MRIHYISITILITIAILSVLKADDIIKSNHYHHILLDSKSDKIAIGKYLFKRIFKNVKPSLAKIKGDSINYPFEHHFSDELHYYTAEKDVSLWLMFRVKNTQNDRKEMILEIDNPLISEIEFFEISKDKIITYNHSGNRFDFSTRQIDHRNFLFQLQIEANTENLYYIYIDNKGRDTVLPMHLYSKNAFMLKEYEKQFVLGFFYALMVLLILFGIFFYIGLSQKLFLYYSVSIFTFLFWTTGYQGFNFQYLWKEIPIIEEYSNTIIGYLAVFCTLRFTLLTYTYQANSKYLPTIIHFSSYLSLLFILFVFFEEELYFFATYLLHPIFFITHIFNILLLIYSVGNTPNLKNYLLIVFGIGLLLVEMYLLQQYFFVLENTGTKPYYLFFYVASYLLIFLGLLNKLRIFPNEEAFQRVIAINKLIAVNEYKSKMEE